MRPLGAVRDWWRAGRHRAELRSAALGAGSVPAAPVLSGTYITPQTALGLTAVYAAHNLISRDLAGLPVGVYRKLPGGGTRAEPGNAIEDLLAVAPNGELDAFRYRQAFMGHVLGWGNGPSEIVRRSGYPEELHLLHPSRTKPDRTKSGKLFYKLNDGTGNTLAPEDVLHFAGLGFDGLQGYTPLTVCRQSIGVGLAAEQFGASFFGNGAIPKGVLKHPKRLSEAAANNLRRSWNQVHQGSQSANQAAILEEGMEWVNTQISPEDAQFLGTRQFTVEEVARLYGVPPHKIGDYSHAHLANVEESNLDYMTTTLVGWVCMLEVQLNLKLLSRDDRRAFAIRFDLSALMRGNSTARAGYYNIMRNMGAMSADDIRTREGMNPLGPDQGGDLYLVQSQYTRLDQAGQGPPDPATLKRFLVPEANGHAH